MRISNKASKMLNTGDLTPSDTRKQDRNVRSTGPASNRGSGQATARGVSTNKEPGVQRNGVGSTSPQPRITRESDKTYGKDKVKVGKNKQSPRGKKKEPERVYSTQREKTNLLVHPAADPRPKKKRKARQGVGLIVSVLVIACLCCAGYFGYNWYIANKPETMDDIRVEIQGLYTDDSKKDLNQTTNMDVLNEISLKLENIDDNGNVQEKEGLINEVDTLKMYLKHIEKLDEMDNPSYDIGTATFEEDLTTIRTESMSYNVPTLTTTIAGRISTLFSEARSITNIRQELISVSGDRTKDPSSYITKIQTEVKHTPNKEELTNVVSYITEKQEILDKLDELNKDKSGNKKQIQAQNTALEDVQKKINEILSPEAVK